MKVGAFNIQTAGNEILAPLLQYVASLPMKDRRRDIGTQSLRLEQAKQSNSAWLLDFTRHRSGGPALSPADGANQDFQMGPDDRFGEEAAAIYIPTSQIFALQYSNAGPRSGTIERYLSLFAEELSSQGKLRFNDVAILPRLTRDSQAKFNRMRAIKRIEISVYMPGLSEDLNAPQTSVGRMLSAACLPHTETLNMNISAGRNTLGFREVVEMGRTLLGFQNGVTKLRVKGADKLGDAAETIDLLSDHLKYEQHIKLGPGRQRHAWNERLLVVGKAVEAWRTQGEI